MSFLFLCPMRATPPAVLLFFVALGWFGCKNTELPPVDALAFPLERLQGKWQDMNRDNAFFEEWAVVGDKHLEGRGYVMASGDTVFIEQLEIVAQDSALLYRVGLNGSRTRDLVEFRMTSATPREIVFENPKHDFPKKISYELQPDSGINVYLSGHEAGQFSEINFSFVRRR